MPRRRFTEDEIRGALRDHASGTSVDELCERLRITRQTFYRWKKKYKDQDSEPRRTPREPGNHRSICLPEEWSLDFCQQLIEFLNAGGGVAYQLVLDAEGVRIEKA